MRFFRLSVVVLTALTISSNLVGCADMVMNTHFEVSTTTFKDDAYALSGTIAVLPADARLNDSLEFRHFEALIAEKLTAVGYTVTEDGKTAGQFALVSYGIDNGKSQVYSTPVFGSTGGGTTYSSGTVYGGGGSASYSGSSYQMPSFGVVGTDVNTMTAYTRIFAVDILSASNMFDGLICTLCEGLGLMRQIRLRARRLTPTA